MIKVAGDKAAQGVDGVGQPTLAEIGDLVDLCLHQSASVNQLWTTYVVATFTGAAFAVTAGDHGSKFLLAAGALGFLAFTVGHIMLVRSGLNRMQLAARDIADALAGAVRPRAFARLARPVLIWPSMTCHIIIDACVIGAFIYQFVKWGAQPA